MKRLVCAFFFAALVVGCEAVVGDLGSYTDNCSPVSDKCPKSSPCVFDFGASAFKCETHVGTKGQDTTCADESECAPGFSCSKFMNNNNGHCTRYCTDESVCGAGCGCHKFGVSRELPTGTEVGACGPLEMACDPISATSTCGAGKRCTLYDSDYTKCDILEESRAVGAACEYLEQCTPGTTCYGNNTDGYFCRRVCNFASPACPASNTCKEYSTPRMLGMQHLGICTP